MSSREHFMSDFGAVIRDPIPVPPDPVPCRNCKDGKLRPQSSDGKAGCNKCLRIHGFIKVGGQTKYGVCL